MSEYFINSTLTLSQCLKCKGWVYECHVNGFLTRVDPTRLNFQTEIAQRLSGRRIFQTFGTVELTLVVRTAWHIEKDDLRAKVFASHSCATPTYFEPEPLIAIAAPTRNQGVPF